MSEFIEVKTQDLSGAALDWAVAVAAEYGPPFLVVAHTDKGEACYSVGLPTMSVRRDHTKWSPSTDWSQCGPLIEEHFVFVGPPNYDCKDYVASIPDPHDDEGCLVVFGQTHLIAACRAIVASILGETVSVPKELLS